MTASIMARPTTGAGPAPESQEPPMTVTDTDLRNLFELIRKRRIEINPDWQYADRITRAVIDDAVYEAEQRKFVELHADGEVTTTKAGRQWLNGDVDETPTVPAAVFQPAAVA
ncbi:hypothetical protein [Micromonospora sp. NPDC050695]|uniref:hypothetical protein n=1 Tax=Micromonospora sp. NPDC050695 TaxID=3154938 RepID=UPI0033F16856